MSQADGTGSIPPPIRECPECHSDIGAGDEHAESCVEGCPSCRAIEADDGTERCFEHDPKKRVAIKP